MAEPPSSIYIVLTFIYFVVVIALLLGPLSRVVHAALLIVFVPVAVVLSACLLPFGRDLAFAGPFVELSAEATPQGQWNVQQFVGTRTDGLRHSSYDELECQDAVTRWIIDIEAATRPNVDVLVT